MKTRKTVQRDKTEFYDYLTEQLTIKNCFQINQLTMILYIL